MIYDFSVGYVHLGYCSLGCIFVQSFCELGMSFMTLPTEPSFVLRGIDPYHGNLYH